MTLLSVLVCLGAGFLALLALCSNLLLWYESFYTPEPRLPAPAPGVFRCAAVFVECLCSFALCALLLPFGSLAKRPPARPLAGEVPELPPLILIHGLYHSASSWCYLARYFERRGYRVSTFSYSSRGSAPEGIAAKLEEHVRRVESLAAGKKPVFIGHSLGGLIVRQWLLTKGNRARAGGLITLGTPHGGSRLACFALGRLGRDLLPDSAFIEGLRAAPPLAPLPCVALASPTDGAVLPASALLPPEDWGFRATRPMGHFSMLYSPSVAGLILRELGNMPASPPRS